MSDMDLIKIIGIYVGDHIGEFHKSRIEKLKGMSLDNGDIDWYKIVRINSGYTAL